MESAAVGHAVFRDILCPFRLFFFPGFHSFLQIYLLGRRSCGFLVDLVHGVILATSLVCILYCIIIQ